jgi:anaerobic dimethyl sulfoxide reductase subunit A
MTASAQYADVVLPVCTFLERNDVYAPMGSGAFALMNKAIEPLGESKSQLDICQALAPKLGITDYNDKTDEEWLRSIHAKWSEEAGLPDFDTLCRQGIARAALDMEAKSAAAAPAVEKAPAAESGKLFATPSGKIELFSQLVSDMNHPQIPTVPTYIETWESTNDPLAEKYPLQLITPHFKRRAHSQFDNLPWLRELQDQLISVHPLDAEKRNIKDGDMVRAYNDRGRMLIRANVTERIMPGVVAIPQGAWFDLDKNGVDRGGCGNTLTKNVTSPAGAFAPNTALIQIEKGEE